MKKIVRTHKILSIMVILLLCFCLFAGIFYIKAAYDKDQAQQKIESALKYNGYTNRVPRSLVHKEETGPFSGIKWYEYTFATKKTLVASAQYQNSVKKHSKKLTLKNCPIVYRVILTPPTTKVKHWTAEIYLDTNQALRDGNQNAYVQQLNKSTDKSLRMRTQDR